MFTDKTEEDFYAALVSEVFVAVNRELMMGKQTGTDELSSIIAAFDEIFHRTDFGELTILRTLDHSADPQQLKFCMHTILFGNYLARKGICLLDVSEDQ